jgi:PAS domain S-box-containing protein
MSGGTWDWDLATGKMAFSPELERILGLEPGAFGGSLLDFMSSVHIEDVEPVAGAITSALHDHSELDLEYRALAADGSTVWIRLSGRVARDDSSRPVGMVGEAVDVTYLHLDEVSAARQRRARGCA